jgi:nitrogen fixation NifU-like protein
MMGTKHSEDLEEAISVIPSESRFWRHARSPQNLGHCPDATASALGIGSCGDKIKVDLVIRGDVLVKVKCAPAGCVYTVACASAMSALATGRSVEEALRLQPENVSDELGGLPEDHLHCARLAVNTLGEAIEAHYRRARMTDRGNSL